MLAVVENEQPLVLAQSLEDELQRSRSRSLAETKRAPARLGHPAALIEIRKFNECHAGEARGPSAIHELLCEPRLPATTRTGDVHKASLAQQRRQFRELALATDQRTLTVVHEQCAAADTQKT